MSFTLEPHRPAWARALGLQMDYDSRPTDRQRSYHDSDRHIEVVVGDSPWSLACEVCRYPEYASLFLAVPRLGIHLRLGPGSEPPAGEMAVSWGVSIFEGDLVFRWGNHHQRITLNPFCWSTYHGERLSSDGEWHERKFGDSEPEWYSEEHPYKIASLPATARPYRATPEVHITVWETVAQCYVQRSTRSRRWLPWWRRVEHHVYFDLRDEVGRGKGSWKGGTVGFSEPLLPGDSVANVVDRAMRKGRGR